MINLKKHIIVFMLFTSIFLSSVNIINANSTGITNSEKQIQISISGFIGSNDNVYDDTLDQEDSGNNNSNNNNNDKLPQTGQSIYFWGIILAIMLIIVGNILRKKYNKQ